MESKSEWLITTVKFSNCEVELKQKANPYIEGKRGEAKKIALPRDLVVWE